MFTNQINQLVLISLILLLGLSCHQKDFDQAILKAKSDKLTEINQPQNGVPFYSKKNLDPTWDSTSDVVKVPKLNLQNHSNLTVDESLFEKKITFIAFFFSSCAGFCSITIKNLQKIPVNPLIKDNYTATTRGVISPLFSLSINIFGLRFPMEPCIRRLL